MPVKAKNNTGHQKRKNIGESLHSTEALIVGHFADAKLHDRGSPGSHLERIMMIWPHLSRSMDKMSPRGPFQPQLFCGIKSEVNPTTGLKKSYPNLLLVLSGSGSLQVQP